jgi:hypothetical protein
VGREMEKTENVQQSLNRDQPKQSDSYFTKDGVVVIIWTTGNIGLKPMLALNDLRNDYPI